jgi:hypothetical protein
MKNKLKTKRFWVFAIGTLISVFFGPQIGGTVAEAVSYTQGS